MFKLRYLFKVLIIFIVMFGIRYIIEYQKNNANQEHTIIEKQNIITDKKKNINISNYFSTIVDNLANYFYTPKTKLPNVINKQIHKTTETFVLSGTSKTYKNKNNTSNIEDYETIDNTKNRSKKPENNITNNKTEETIQIFKDIKPFKTSSLYKNNCASCHGKTGTGFHRTNDKFRKLVGSTLTRLNEKYIYSILFDYKDDIIENVEMNLATKKLSNTDIKNLSIEISKFKNNF